jgi:hypothetical protein
MTSAARIGLGIVLTTVGGLWGLAQQPTLRTEGHDELSILMRAKLSSSQKVVEGLTSGDFDMIGKGALDLQKICDATGWRTRDDQVYGHYRAELKRTALKIVEQAAEQNLDGAAYGYMHALTTCINCHAHGRNVLRVADASSTLRAVPIPVTEQENAAHQARTLWR